LIDYAPGMVAIHAGALRILGVLGVLGAVTGCGQGALGLLPGVINDPQNHSLRRDILAYGKTRVCDELRSRSMPLRFRDEDPIAGRFFPVTCASRDLPNGDVYVQFAGRGYVWTSMSQRLGFEASSAIEYDTDFLLDGSTMYVYFRPRAGSPPAFATRFVEAPQAALFSGLLGGQGMTNGFGAQVMQGQLTRGFTVIRDESGSVELAPGVVPRGSRPTEAFRDLDRSRWVLANERSEVRARQRDFVGPFDVPPGKKLGLIVSVDGAPAVEVVLVPRDAGEAWLLAYTGQAALTPPPALPLLDEVVPAGSVHRRSLAVAPGAYYLVLDNTRPGPATSGNLAAVVSYALALE
jgi:hypothetical protein